jgi:hypothetical protein
VATLGAGAAGEAVDEEADEELEAFVVDADLVDGEAVDGGDQEQVALDGQVRGEAAGAEDGQDAL